MKYLVIIPARGGSKGIPRKNIVSLRGEPLIAFSISSALSAFANDSEAEIIVSTDDVEIKEVAEQFGATVPFLRPTAIADDKSSSIEYVLHAVDFFKKTGNEPQNIVILQPTSPLRTADDIKIAIRKYESCDSESLISVYIDETMNEKIMYRVNGSRLKPVVGAHNDGSRRQDDLPVAIRNGAIYIVSTKFLMSSRRLFSDQPHMYEMPKYRSINIDTLEDLNFVEKLV